MSKFTGRLYEVGIGKETSRGTGVAPDFWIPKTSLSFDDKISKALTAGSYGHISDAPFTGQIVSKWAEGDIEGEVNANSFGLILLALCGTVNTDGPTDSAYTHSYTIENDVDPDSLSIQTHDPIGDLRFRLAMINSLSMEVTLGEMVKFTANFISKVHQDIGTASPSYSRDHRFVSKDLTLKVADDVGSLSAASKLSVKNLTIEFARNVERIDILGTPEPEDILSKGFRITGTIELNYEDRTWRDYMVDGSVKAMQIKLESSKTIGATAVPTLDIQFPKVHFEEWEPALGLDDISSQSINFDVMFDLANTRLWSTFDLINTQASY